MSTAEGTFVLRAHGVLYSIGLASDALNEDWLDRVILKVTEEPQNVSDLVRCFGLPRRLIEDAIGRLIEQHRLLLDVGRARVRASGIVLRAPAMVESTMLIWQDHVTGSVLPWEVIKPLCEGPPEEIVTTNDLRGGPPKKTVLEMSDAELLMRLERHRPDASWSEIVAHKERVRRESMLISARRREAGGIVLLDRVPRLLARLWGRFADVGTLDAPTLERVELPRAWWEIRGDWLQVTNSRIDALASGITADVGDAAAVALAKMRATAEQYFKAELVPDGGTFVRQKVNSLRQSGRDHRFVVAASQKQGGYGDAISLLREAHAEERYLLLGGGRLKQQHRENVRALGAHLVSLERDDVEFVLLDDRELLVGGARHRQPYSLRISTARPLLALAAWLPEAARWDARSVGRSHIGEDHGIGRVLQDALALDSVLREIEQTPVSADGGVPIVANEMVQRLRDDLRRIESDLNTVNLTPATAMDADEVLAALDERSGGRVLVRSEASPLLQSASSHDVIVCSPDRPKICVRWTQEASPAEVVILGDVVIVGWWSYPGPGEPPPFLAFHTPTVAAELQTRTDAAALVNS